MKKGKVFLSLLLSGSMLLGTNALAFGATIENVARYNGNKRTTSESFAPATPVPASTPAAPVASAPAVSSSVDSSDAAYALYEQVNEALEAYTSYQYKGTVNMNMDITGMESPMTMSMTMEGMGKGTDASYVVATSTTSGISIKSESLVQDGKLYVRTSMPGQAETKWAMTDVSDLLQADMMSQLKGFTGKDVPGLTYSFGDSKVIDNVECTQVIIDVDPSFMQYLMSTMSDTMTQSITGAAGVADLSADDLSELNDAVTELINSMIFDMKIRCFIDEDSMLLKSMTLDGNVTISMDDEKVSMNFSGDVGFFGYNEPVNLPVIKDSDVIK